MLCRSDYTPYAAVIFLGTQLRGNNNNISNPLQVDCSIRHRLLLEMTDNYIHSISNLSFTAHLA